MGGLQWAAHPSDARAWDARRGLGDLGGSLAPESGQPGRTLERIATIVTYSTAAPPLHLSISTNKKIKIVRAARLSGCQYKLCLETVMDGRCSLSDQFSPSIVYCRPLPATRLASASNQTFQAKPSLIGWQPLKYKLVSVQNCPPIFALHAMHLFSVFVRIFSLSENRDIVG